LNKYPTLYYIQRWISGRRGLEPRCKPDLLPCFPFVLFPFSPCVTAGQVYILSTMRCYVLSSNPEGTPDYRAT